ncbi:hypothetical protein [Bradyrhizobium canariense]|uniref:hypothetical protein n=1 Tax=Bradyrhizobium canariense TaxID=255045 RepID=UPI001431EE1C|nr:hypothetical protein [Bradyrhizobium canariense]
MEGYDAASGVFRNGRFNQIHHRTIPDCASLFKKDVWLLAQARGRRNPASCNGPLIHQALIHAAPDVVERCFIAW